MTIDLCQSKRRGCLVRQAKVEGGCMGCDVWRVFLAHTEKARQKKEGVEFRNLLRGFARSNIPPSLSFSPLHPPAGKMQDISVGTCQQSTSSCDEILRLRNHLLSESLVPPDFLTLYISYINFFYTIFCDVIVVVCGDFDGN